MRLNAGSKPVLAAGEGDLDSLSNISEDINLRILIWEVKPARWTSLPLCCNNKHLMGKKRQRIKQERNEGEKAEQRREEKNIMEKVCPVTLGKKASRGE